MDPTIDRLLRLAAFGDYEARLGLRRLRRRRGERIFVHELVDSPEFYPEIPSIWHNVFGGAGVTVFEWGRFLVAFSCMVRSQSRAVIALTKNDSVLESSKVRTKTFGVERYICTSAQLTLLPGDRIEAVFWHAPIEISPQIQITDREPSSVSNRRLCLVALEFLGDGDVL